MRKIILASCLVAAAACAGSSANQRPTPSWSSEQVRMIQRSLTERGYPVEPTGALDGDTQAALASFQRSRDLPPSGAIDDPTLLALGIDPADVTPVRGRTASDEARAEEEKRLQEIWTSP